MKPEVQFPGSSLAVPSSTNAKSVLFVGLIQIQISNRNHQRSWRPHGTRRCKGTQRGVDPDLDHELRKPPKILRRTSVVPAFTAREFQELAQTLFENAKVKLCACDGAAGLVRVDSSGSGSSTSSSRHSFQAKAGYPRISFDLSLGQQAVRCFYMGRPSAYSVSEGPAGFGPARR